MLRATCLVASVLLLGLFSADPSWAGEIEVVDATPPFWTFWEAAAKSGYAERPQLFLDTVVAAHPELFSTTVLQEQALSGDASHELVLARIESYLQALPPYIASMRQISATIGRDFRAYADDFTRSFPDYAPNTPVFFTVSLFQFDGGTRPVGNRTALLFGIDAIARFHGADTNLKVLFDHELFHQYHDQIAPELTDDDAPLWASLWEEGLATYVSQRMNPGSTDAQVLMFPSNLAEQAAPLMRELASELRANFRSTDREEYALFFFGQKVRANWPPRSGYYVGYRIAQTLGQGHSLQEIAAWRGAPLQEAVRKALDDFAAAPVTLMPNPRS